MRSLALRPNLPELWQAGGGGGGARFDIVSHAFPFLSGGTTWRFYALSVFDTITPILMFSIPAVCFFRLPLAPSSFNYSWQQLRYRRNVR